MSLAANVLEPVEDTRYFGPAVVTEGETSDGRVLVRLGVDGPGPTYTARVAVPRGRPLATEQEVLITGDPAGELYVVGTLGAPTSDMAAPSVLGTEAGAYATVSAKSDGERLQVYSRRNELLFEYHPGSGQARVNVARGDLELGTEDGDITLKSAGTVRIDGASIELTGRTLEVRTTHARWIVDRLETVAGTLVEKAKNAYRTVEQLAQLKTGRMRTLVDETYQFKSKRAFLKAEEDFKIKGEQIHLG